RRPQLEEEDEDLEPVVSMISKELNVLDLISRTMDHMSVEDSFMGRRTKRSRPIQFDEYVMADQTENTEDQPMIISASIGGFRVERVFVDEGSAKDIIFWDCFERMGLTKWDLQPYPGVVYGFNGSIE
ncbi:hypothetical protein L2V44_14250, partial [Staphylococcus aureus]|nr:hypothetical protein [Staphylococcus aureus]